MACCFGKCKQVPIDPIDPALPLHEILLCSVNSRVYAIHKVDGSILWQVKSPVGSSGGIVSLRLLENDGRVLLGAGGRAACLDVRTANVLWTRKMPRRWIFNEVIINTHTEPSTVLPSTTGIKEKQGSGSIPGKTSHASQAIVTASTWGRVYAYHQETGESLWMFNCPGGRFGFPTLSRAAAGNILFVGCNTMLYCVHLQTGQLIWRTPLVKRASSLASYCTLATSSQADSDQVLVQVENLEAKVLAAAKIFGIILLEAAKAAGG